MDQETDKRRYLIFGHYGGSNTGDEAMVWCILERLARRGGGVVRLVTKGETVATGFPGVEAVSTSPLDLWRGALWCDELVLGGGTHFHDDYTPWRYLRHAAYMGRIVLLALLVKLRGRKFRLVGMGFGPFNGFTGKIPTALALRMADTVTTRDGASCQAARSCWKEASVVEAFDLAALLEPDEVPDVDPDWWAFRWRSAGPTPWNARTARSGGNTLPRSWRRRRGSRVRCGSGSWSSGVVTGRMTSA